VGNSFKSISVNPTNVDFDNDYSLSILLNDPIFKRKAAQMKNEEAMELFKLYKSTGELKYRDKIVEGYMKLMLYVAIKYWQPGFLVSDLLQEAVMGFMLGIDKYNNEKYSEFGKAKLSSYCFFYSRKYIIDFIEKNKCIVKITYSPLRASQKLKKMMDTAVAVMELDERMIPLDVVLKQNVTMEMAAALGALSATTAIVSTNNHDEIDFVSDGGIYSYEMYSVTEYAITFEHINTLNEKAKDLLLSKYNLIEQTFDDMCSKHKVSTSSGNKFVKETIAHLKKSLK
jgi:DNA-directed RNA polymerase specialized sigma subunit